MENILEEDDGSIKFHENGNVFVIIIHNRERQVAFFLEK